MNTHVGSTQYGYLRPVCDTPRYVRIRVGRYLQKVAKNLGKSFLLDMVYAPGKVVNRDIETESQSLLRMILNIILGYPILY